MQNHNYYVYILTNRQNGTLYIGVTNDLDRRLWQHRHGQASRFTNKYNLHRLIWFEHHTDVSEAILREKRLKKWNRDWKIALIEKTNPNWRDLGYSSCHPRESGDLFQIGALSGRSPLSRG